MTVSIKRCSILRSLFYKLFPRKSEKDDTRFRFVVNDSDYNPKELMRICANGDIFVKGKLIENDKEVVDGLREFLKEAKRERE